VSVDTTISKCFLEDAYIHVGWPIKGKTRHLVVANEVDVAPDGACQISKHSGVMRPVVDAPQEQVLKGYFAARRIEVLAACIKNLSNTGMCSPWDKRASE
jgi:hypothetical protein